MKTIRVVLMGLMLGTVACGDGGDGGESESEVGHCVTEATCTDLVEGNADDFAYVCGLTGGTPAAGTCETADYDRKCTQTIDVSEDGAASRKETYVIYYKADDETQCVGEEEEI